MKKIRLDLDALKVESFVTSDLGSRSEGTVFAMANTLCDNTCDELVDTCNHPVNCDIDSDFECEWTMFGVSCTYGTDPTQFGCESAECETEEDCTEALTDCDGGGTH